MKDAFAKYVYSTGVYLSTLVQTAEVI